MEAGVSGLIQCLLAKWESGKLKNEPAAVLVDSSIRYNLHRTVTRSLPQLAIIAYNEIPNGLVIDASGVLTHEDVFGDAPTGGGFNLSMFQGDPSSNESDRS